MASHRYWIETRFGRNFRQRRNDQPFTLMSYNILAQTLLNKHPELYQYHDPFSLNWHHRLNCLRNEITAIRPSILCLQEVQESHLDEISDALLGLNFGQPLYKKRTGSDLDDGCAIFYETQLFELLDHHFVEYYQPNVDKLDRFNVAIIAKFTSKKSPNLEFIVATTHLLYNPKRCDIRTAQLQILMAELSRLSIHSKTNAPLPIILTGDFNCEPWSQPYNLVHKGVVEEGQSLPINLGIMDDCQHVNVTVHNNRKDTALFHSAKQDAPKQTPENENGDVDKTETVIENVQTLGLPHNTGTIWHYLNLKPTIISDAMVSTFQDRWIQVDYIFYTKFERHTSPPNRPKYSYLQLLGNYELPHERRANEIGLIPNCWLGSDHFSMASEFVLLGR